MQGLFSRPFNALDATDLSDLVDVRKVREHLNLDYKLEGYRHNHQGAVEMLADVTAMANAQGGYILTGVEEDKTQPDGTPKRVVGVENGDVEANWIQSVCLSSIDEKITGLCVRDIPLPSGLSCVIIQIPNSIRKPHMIVHERHRSFRIRHGREKSLMGMQEVRSMIVNMNAYRASLADFIRERKQALRDMAAETPWLLMMSTPIYVDREKIDPLRDDIRDILREAPGRPDSRYNGIFTGIPEPRIFGVEAVYPKARPRQPYERILRLFRNGHLEYCENHVDDVRGESPFSPHRVVLVYSYKTIVRLLNFLEIAKRVMQIGQINEPIAVTAHWQNFSPSLLMIRDRSHTFEESGVFTWPEEGFSIELTASDLSSPTYLARCVADRLFNAFGIERSSHFDDDNNLVKWR